MVVEARTVRSGKEPLHGDYYRTNFHTLVSFVIDTYSDLLLAEELQWYDRLCSLQQAAQCLYIRLLLRRRSTFRQSRLYYAEITDLAQAAEELAGVGLADTRAPDDLAILLACYNKAQIRDILGLHNQADQGRVALLDTLLQAGSAQRQDYLRRLQDADRWLSVSGHRFFTLMQLCFFGNLRQDISEFVLRDLGTLKYAPYDVAGQFRAFNSRDQIEAHLVYYECEAVLASGCRRDLTKLLLLAERLPAITFNDPHLSRRVDRLRNTIARELERLGQTDMAISLYQRSMHPPARERLARLALDQSRLEDAHRVCTQMLEQPLDAAEHDVAQRLLQRWRKLSGKPPTTVPRYRPPSSHLVLNERPLRVEYAVRDYYAAKGECRYVENSLFTSMLGLVIWDILYQPAPGAFFNPFQVHPSDYYLPSFRKSRQEALDRRFRQIEQAEFFEELVLSHFSLWHGIVNPLVRWHRTDEQALHMALKRIPVMHWQAIFRNLLDDLRQNVTGIPDLIFYPDEGGYELIEVKGPGDNLQQNQLRWFRFFNEQRIPARVVRIAWA